MGAFLVFQKSNDPHIVARFMVIKQLEASESGTAVLPR